MALSGNSRPVLIVILVQRMATALAILGAAAGALFAAKAHPGAAIRLVDLRGAISCATIACLLIASEIIIVARSRARSTRQRSEPAATRPAPTWP